MAAGPSGEGIAASPTSAPQDDASAAAEPGKPAGALPIPPLAGVAIVLAIYLLSQFVSEILMSLYASLHGMSSDAAIAWQSSSTAAQFAYVLIVESLTLGLLLGFMRSRRPRLTLGRLGLTKPRLLDPLATLLAYPVYFLLNLGGTLGAVALFHINSNQQQQVGFTTAKSSGDLAMAFISLVVLPPLVEEIIMRGFLFGSLKSRFTVVQAALITSALFALAHLEFGSNAPLLWVAAVDTFMLSLVLCYLRQKTGRLWAGIGLHGLKNAVAYVALFVAPHVHAFGSFGAVLLHQGW